MLFGELEQGLHLGACPRVHLLHLARGPAAHAGDQPAHAEGGARVAQNGGVAVYTRNVKRWRGGRMILRWVGAALTEVQKGFRRVRGHDDLPKLVAALTRHAVEGDQQKVA